MKAQETSRWIRGSELQRDWNDTCKLNFEAFVGASELYKDWNDTSIRPAVWLSEAKLMAAGGSHVWQKHASVVVLYR